MATKASRVPLGEIASLTPTDAAILRDHLIQDLDYPEDHRDVRLLAQAANRGRLAGNLAPLPLSWDGERLNSTQPYAYVVDGDDVPACAPSGHRVGCTIRLMLPGSEWDVPAWRTFEVDSGWTSEPDHGDNGYPQVSFQGQGDPEDDYQHGTWVLLASGEDADGQSYEVQIDVLAEEGEEDGTAAVGEIQEALSDALDRWEPETPSEAELMAAVVREAGARQVVTVTAYAYPDEDFDEEEPEYTAGSDDAAYAAWEQQHEEWELRREEWLDEREMEEHTETLYVGRHFDELLVVWGDYLYDSNYGDISANVIHELEREIDRTDGYFDGGISADQAQEKLREDIWRAYEWL